jgi:nucleoside-diphosphate-sugar epimerase
MPRREAGAKRKTVAVTGASGYIATKLIRSLLDTEEIERVLGFDVTPPAITHDRFVFDQIDVRSPALESRLQGVDVLVHLAFIMDPIRDEAEMRDVNVNGSQNAFRSAAKAGVRKIVYTSSATVYGAHPDNPIPLTEDSPLRANLDFSYPAHKLEIEYVVREFRDEFPSTLVTVFRPAIVFGPNVDNAWSHLLEAPLFFSVQGYRPPLQFVHEDDVAAVLTLAATQDIDGVFNLAAEGFLEADEMLDIVGRRRFEIPEPVAFSLLDCMWSLGLAEAPSGMLHYVMHPWVVSTEKLTEAGFTCKYSNRETFIEAVEKARGRIRLGDRSFRRGDLARGAVVGAGVAAALFATRRVRRRARAA